MSKRYLINEELAQALLDYLKLRPYVEVYKLIPMLQELPEAEDHFSGVGGLPTISE